MHLSTCLVVFSQLVVDVVYYSIVQFELECWLLTQTTSLRDLCNQI